jgi:hypothetical protein
LPVSEGQGVGLTRGLVEKLTISPIVNIVFFLGVNVNGLNCVLDHVSTKKHTAGINRNKVEFTAK